MRTNPILILVPAAAAWLLGGCCSDPTAPQDRLPPLANRSVAAQSGYLAAALVEVAPVSLVYDGGKSKDKGLSHGSGIAAGAEDGNYSFEFEPDNPVQGIVYLHFRQGGPEGTPGSYEAADWARAWTAGAEPLTIDLVPDGIPWQLGFELFSDIERAAGKATVNGGGILVVGDYTADWTVADLMVLDDDDWPREGKLTFVNEGIVAEVTFNGDDTATVTVGEEAYIIDLNTGALIEI